MYGKQEAGDPGSNFVRYLLNESNTDGTVPCNNKLAISFVGSSKWENAVLLISTASNISERIFPSFIGQYIILNT